MTIASRPPGFRHALRRGQPVGKLAQITVQMDADRLEGPRRRVLLVMRLVTERTSHDPRQFSGPRDRPRRDNRPCDPAGARLLAIFMQHIGNHRFVGEVG